MPNSVPVDFRRPPYLSRRQIQAVRQAHESFARSLSANLSAYFRLGVEVSIDTIDLITYSEFVERGGVTASWAGLWLPSEAVRAVLQMTPNVVFPLLELILGGNSRLCEPIERELTEIERNLVEGVTRIILKEWKESWSQLAPFDFLVEGVQSSPNIIDLLPPAETVLAASIDFRVSETRGRMNFAIPALTVRSLWQQGEPLPSPSAVPADSGLQENLWQLVQPSTVTVEAQIPGVSIRLSDLINLAGGHVLKFDYPVSRPIPVRANQSYCFDGRLGRKGSRRVLRIESSRSAHPALVESTER